MTETAGISRALREIAWIVHRRAPQRAGVGPIPTTELALLRQVIETPGCTVSELTEKLGLRQPNVSNALRTLIDRGLVTRESSPHDRRRALISPTDRAASEDRAISDEWIASLERAFRQLSAEDVAALGASEGALVRLLAALREDVEPG